MQRNKNHSFDHLVGAGEQSIRNGEAEFIGGLEIEDQLECGGLFDGDVAGFRTLENLVHENGGAAKLVKAPDRELRGPLARNS